MAGVIGTGSHPKALWPGIKAFWGQTYNEHREEFSKLYDVMTSEKAYEEEVQITPFGLAPVKQQGAAIATDTETQGPVARYNHIAYALRYDVTWEELRDNLYEEVSRRRAKALANAMRQTKENVGAMIYNRAFNSSYTFADGVSLINTAHPNTSGGTYSNELSVSAQLSEASLEDLTILVMRMQNDRGLTINLMPESLHVPTQQYFEASRIVKSVYQTGTANNDVNIIAANGFPKGVHVNHYFASPTAYFIRTSAPNGMQHFIRDPISFQQDNDFSTRNAMASCYERYSFGVTDPRALVATPGT